MPNISPSTTRVTTASSHHDHHGEDDMFVNEYLQIVADGVGGTKISSAPFSKALVFSITKTLEKAQLKYEAQVPPHVMKKAVNLGIKLARERVARLTTVHQMCATLNVTYLNLMTLEMFNMAIGDAKTVVLRNYGRTVVFESVALVHEFNVPATVSTNAMETCETFGLKSKFYLQPGDLVFSCSDGLTDNLSIKKITKTSRRLFSDEKPKLEKLARTLVALAHEQTQVGDKSRSCPFAISAGMEYQKRAMMLSRSDSCTSTASTEQEEQEDQEAVAHLLGLESLEKFRGFSNEIVVDQEELLKFHVSTGRVKNPKARVPKMKKEGKQNWHYSPEQLKSFATSVSGKQDDISLVISRIDC